MAVWKSGAGAVVARGKNLILELASRQQHPPWHHLGENLAGFTSG